MDTGWSDCRERRAGSARPARRGAVPTLFAGGWFLGKALILAVCACVLAQPVQAAEYFVRVGGSDDNDGASPETAFRTIGRAAAAVDNPGDVVRVGPGTYPEGNIGPAFGGTRSLPVVFRADPTLESGGGEVVVDPPAAAQSGFLLLGLRHIVIDGFTVHGGLDAAVQARTSGMRGPSADLVLRNLIVRDGTRTGIDLVARGEVVVESCEVSGHGSTGISIADPCPGSDACGSPPSARLTVRLRDVMATGNGSHGIFVSGAAGGTVASVTVNDNDGSGFRARASSDLVLEDNSADGNGNGGMVVLGGDPQSSHRLSGNRAERNAGGGIDLAIKGAVLLTDNQVVGSTATGISVADASVSESSACPDEPTVCAEDISIDVEIRGNTVSGSGSLGIFVARARSALVHDNMVAESGDNGIRVQTTAELTATGNAVSASGTAGLLLANPDGLVAMVTAAENDIRGGVTGSGIDLTSDGTVVVRDNTTHDHAGSGVSLHDALPADECPEGEECPPPPRDELTVEITGNQADGNGAHGVLFVGAGEATVSTNTATDNLGHGIRGEESGAVEMADNVVSGNQSGGLAVLNAAGRTAVIEVRRNQVDDNGRAGIELAGEGEVVVEDNEVTESAAAGVWVQRPRPVCPTEPCPDSEPAGMLDASVQDNVITGSGAHGILTVRATDASIQGNDVGGSGRSGIRGEEVGRWQARNNQVSGSDTSGILVTASPDAERVEVSDNAVGGTRTGTGIRITTTGEIEVTGNHVLRSGASGISVSGAATIDDTTARIVANRVGQGGVHGIFVDRAVDSRIETNTCFSNGATGITVREARAPFVFNNLVYDAGEDGLAMGTDGRGVREPTLLHNTVFANQGWGIRIDDASPGGLVVHNILSANQDGGITVHRGSTCGYAAGFNINRDGYGERTPFNIHDRDRDPLFADPDGADDVLGGDGADDDDFRLRAGSPAIDGGGVDAETLGLTGSARLDGEEDTGPADLGVHAGADPAAGAVAVLPFMPVYVRLGGNDANKGREPGDALATLAAGAQRAQAGAAVIVGPGTWLEGNVSPPPHRGRAFFIADPRGELTGDAAGPVLVDASGASTGFLLTDACASLVDGFHVRGAADAGVQVRAGSDATVVQNNVLFDNRVGINVQDADLVRIENNLAYANDGGISVGRTPQGDGAVGAVIRNNTCAANEFVGILIGAGGPAPCAQVHYNVLHENGTAGLQIGSGLGCPDFRLGFESGYNVNADIYGGCAPRAATDLTLAPLFVDPDGADGQLGGSGFVDDSFHLAQRAAGQSADSPALDLAPITAAEARLEDRSTRSDGVPDAADLDAGFHYPSAETMLRRPRDRSLETGADLSCAPPPSAGDCDADGVVTISEMVRAVRIALGELQLDACVPADPDGDGRVTVSNLIEIVNVALTQTSS